MPTGPDALTSPFRELAESAGDRRAAPRPIPRPGGTPGWPPEQPAFGADWVGRTGRTGSWARRIAVALAAVVVAAGAAAAFVLALG